VGEDSEGAAAPVARPKDGIADDLPPLVGPTYLGRVVLDFDPGKDDLWNERLL